MVAKKRLIVNADEFGLSFGVNQGIIEAYEQGIVTSASLMVHWPAAAEAAAYARGHPDLSLGLHVDLGEWAYRDGAWVAIYEVVPEDDSWALAHELSRQLSSFRELVGEDPTHIDSHQHVHLRESVLPLVRQVAASLGVPLRQCKPEIGYCGAFYGQTAAGSPFPEGISVGRLHRILTQLPPGVTELSCHPGESDELDTMYRSERSEEVRVLCDPRIRAAIAAVGIELCSFRSLGRRGDEAVN
jgi:predicted glycoside hydrolase/deacetylase ChbG (UPF0249 family)